jgi:hypothetical protein
VPVAVYVITQEDIRRSAAHAAELFPAGPRHAGGAARFHNWAVSVRGFNSLFSNKLLVLVDGRTILQPGLLGRHLEYPDLLLDDIDRIEVAGGPAPRSGAPTRSTASSTSYQVRGRHPGRRQRLGGGTFEGQTAASVTAARRTTAYRVLHWASRAVDAGERCPRRRPVERLSAGAALIDSGLPRFLLEGTFADSNTRQLGPRAQGLDDRTSDTRQASALARWTPTRRVAARCRSRRLSIHRVHRARTEPDAESVADLDPQPPAFGPDTIFTRRLPSFESVLRRVPGFSGAGRRLRSRIPSQDEIALAGMSRSRSAPRSTTRLPAGMCSRRRDVGTRAVAASWGPCRAPFARHLRTIWAFSSGCGSLCRRFLTVVAVSGNPDY